MRDQIFRIVFGSVFLFGSTWLDFKTEVSLFSLLIAYVTGALLLFRAIPFPFWERWAIENRPPQS